MFIHKRKQLKNKMFNEIAYQNQFHILKSFDNQ